MQIQSAKRQEEGGILVVSDEGTLTVPEVVGNRHYDALLRWVEEGNVIQEPAQKPLHELKIDRILEINRQAQALANEYTRMYPEFEQQTWEAQEREARAFFENASTPTPTLYEIAHERKIAIPNLAAKVIEKADTFRLLSSRLAGKRQALEDQIMAAQTPEEVEAVVWTGL